MLNDLAARVPVTKRIAVLASIWAAASFSAQPAFAETDEATTAAITGSNGRAITGSNGRAITGSNGRAITGSNGRAITGSNGRAITGSNGRAITGSNGRAITGSNGRAITGSNGRAITGSNGRAITGSNGRAITGSNGRAITGSNGRAITAFERFALGPVESTEDGAALVVAGQRFDLDASYAIGDYVAVGTFTDGDGPAIFDIDDSYVPGVSIIQVVGTVEAVDAAQGTVSVGGAVVDYTSLLASDPGLTLSVGEKVILTGTQPVPGGIIIAMPVNDRAVVVVSSDVENLTQGGTSGDSVAGTRD